MLHVPDPPVLHEQCVIMICNIQPCALKFGSRKLKQSLKMLLVLCVFSSTVELHYTRFTQNIIMISSLRMNSLIEAIMINYQFEPDLKLIWIKHFDKKL